MQQVTIQAEAMGCVKALMQKWCVSCVWRKQKMSRIGASSEPGGRSLWADVKTLGPCPESRMTHWGLEQSRVMLSLMFMRASQAAVWRTSDGDVENGLTWGERWAESRHNLRGSFDLFWWWIRSRGGDGSLGVKADSWISPWAVRWLALPLLKNEQTKDKNNSS